MPKSTPAKISFPLDIPQVDVLGTEQKQYGKFIITVESRIETTKCGVCQQEIACNYGHGQAIELRHLAILGQETYIAIRPHRGQCPTCVNKPTTTQTLEWYEQRSPHTKAYDRHLMKLLIGSTVPFLGHWNGKSPVILTGAKSSIWARLALTKLLIRKDIRAIGLSLLPVKMMAQLLSWPCWTIEKKDSQRVSDDNSRTDAPHYPHFLFGYVGWLPERYH